MILFLIRKPYSASSDFSKVGDLPYISETGQQNVALGIR